MSSSSALAIAVSALAASSGGHGHQPETNNNSILSAVHQPMQVGFTMPLAHSINSGRICNTKFITPTLHLQIPNTVQLQPVTTSMQPSLAAPAPATTTTTVVLQPKPVTLEKINPVPANSVSPLEF